MSVLLFIPKYHVSSGIFSPGTGLQCTFRFHSLASFGVSSLPPMAMIHSSSSSTVGLAARNGMNPASLVESLVSEKLCFDLFMVGFEGGNSQRENLF